KRKSISLFTSLRLDRHLDPDLRNLDRIRSASQPTEICKEAVDVPIRRARDRCRYLRRSLDPHHIAFSQSFREFLLRRRRSVPKIGSQTRFLSSPRTVREPANLIRGSASGA